MIKINWDKLDNAFPKAYFDFSAGCIEPGYDDNPVILADWNHVPNKVFDSLESKGFNCEWSDEWITCDNCYKSFRCVGDSYFWTMFGVIFDGYALCGNCLSEDPIEYLESLENNPNNAIVSALLDIIPLDDYGYKKYNPEKFYCGLHEGMNDNPSKILKLALDSDPGGKFIFAIAESSQFYITFDLYKKENNKS